MHKIISILVVGAIGVGVIILFCNAFNTEQKNKCLEFERQAKIFQTYDQKNDTGFYITPDEKAMCDELGVSVSAHVKE